LLAGIDLRHRSREFIEFREARYSASRLPASCKTSRALCASAAVTVGRAVLLAASVGAAVGLCAKAGAVAGRADKIATKNATGAERRKRRRGCA
jgi:hypothetical protein